MVKKVIDFSKSVNKFTNNVNSVINLKNIPNTEFLNDVNELKSKDISNKDFINKYNDLFNGNTSFYGKKHFNTSKFEKKAIESFLGSYRRNVNPKYYNQSTSQDIVDFNRDMRFLTMEKAYLDDKIAKTFRITKHVRTIKTSKVHYKEKIGYRGFAKTEISNLKETWELNKVVKNSLFSAQEIQFRLNYDLIDDKGNIVYSDQWITIRSNISPNRTLLNLYNDALDKVLQYIAKLEQSKLFIKLKLVCTYAFREAN